MAVTVLLPPWYIYCLVAVLSLFRLMEKKENKDRLLSLFGLLVLPHLLMSIGCPQTIEEGQVCRLSMGY
jgi:hypothetical protein